MSWNTALTVRQLGSMFVPVGYGGMGGVPVLVHGGGMGVMGMPMVMSGAGGPVLVGHPGGAAMLMGGPFGIAMGPHMLEGARMFACKHCGIRVDSATEVTSAGSHHKPNCKRFDSSTRRGSVSTNVLHEGSGEFKRVYAKLMEDQTHRRSPTVKYIKRIAGHSLGEHGRHNVVELWHGTEVGGATGIIREGFRLPDRPGAFGAGVYFASESCKSLSYGNELLLCEVAIGRTLVVRSPDNSLTLDSLLGKGADSLHHDPRSGSFNHHEYIVFRASQAIPKYSIEYTDKVSACTG